MKFYKFKFKQVKLKKTLVASGVRLTKGILKLFPKNLSQLSKNEYMQLIVNTIFKRNRLILINKILK